MEAKAAKTNILVVEDEKEIGSLLKTYLTKRGFVVQIATDADRALFAYYENRPDIALVDIYLPGRSGLELVKEIRSRENGSPLPVVLMSAVFSSNAEDPAARGLQISAFLPKPLLLKDVETTLRRALAASDTSGGEIVNRGELGPVSGQLTPRRAARTVIGLHDARRSGFLRVKNGEAEIALTLLRGVPVNARSSLRQHTLGAYLVAVGRFTEDQVRRVDREMRAQKLRFGEAAAQLGLLSPAEALDVLRSAAQARAAHAVTWSEGELKFIDHLEKAEADALSEIDPCQIVLNGYLTHGDVAEAIASFGEHRHRYVCASDRFQEYAKLLQQVSTQQALVQQVPQSPQLGDLLLQLQDSGPEAIRLLYAMWAADMVSFEDERLVCEELPAAETQVVCHATDAAGANPQDELIFAEYLRCQAADFYAMLRLPRTAQNQDVQAAAQKLLQELASGTSEGALQPTAQGYLAELRGWIAQAQKVLTSPEQRRAYDKTLGDQSVAVPAGLQNAEAESAFHRGQDALSRLDYETAVEALREAVELCPTDPDYIAMLGWAETRRGAADLQMGYLRLGEICSNHPQAARAFMYLGLVALERGDTGRAKRALQRAIGLDPNLEEAQDSLRRLG